MRLCILHRPNAISGGDFVALKGYAGALHDKGVEVLLRSANQVGSLDSFDYVHLWAACSPDWGLPAAREVASQNKRLLVTPFWWSRTERQTFFGREGRDLTEGYTPAVAETLRLANVLFPVTMSEAVECWKLAPNKDVWIVPMGIDRPSVEAQEPEDYVLSIGRIEPHKNQYMLAEACKRLGYKLVMVGKTTSEGYTQQVVEASGNQVTIIRDASNEERDRLLAYARVHALPSFFENPGLVHGEALSIGVPTVAGSHGCEPEFYRESPFYCDTTSLDSITHALEDAWSYKRCMPDLELPTWEIAALRALECMD